MAEMPKCKICGTDAVALVRDVVRRPQVGKAHCPYEPDGPFHAFCAEHERPSQARTDETSMLASILSVPRV